MALSDEQKKEVEQAIIAGNKLDAYRIYRDACQCTLHTAKTEVAQIEAQLRVTQPEQFNQLKDLLSEAKQFKIGTGAIIAFVLIDILFFVGIAWWFMSPDDDSDKANTANKTNNQSQVKTLPTNIDSNNYQVALEGQQTFQSLYEEKINSSAYQRHKRKSRGRYDETDEEPAIKMARSHLAANRVPPSDQQIRTIPANITQQPAIDGALKEGEWRDATRIKISDEHNTTLYFMSDGEWLFVACDAKDELTDTGFDQFRVYLHAGLIPELKNERVHLGRNSHITSIRQTTFRWQGEPPDNDKERWKKYAISDWGIYRYATGATQLNQHRQYEIAIHMAEAGLHQGVPFTLFAVIETDPLRDENKKFKKRQYLGSLGSQKEPTWFTIN